MADMNSGTSKPRMKPQTRLWLVFITATVVIALALFLSAGTISYWQAWVYLGVSTAASIPLTLHILNDPVLLENRSKGGPTSEQRPIQRIIVACLMIPYVAAFVVPGLDHRFGWSVVPSWLSAVGDIAIVVALWMVDRVFKENSHASASVEITQDQKVISSGPYAIVRHPMYSGAAVYFIGMSLALGSYWGLIPSALVVLALVWRLLDEERFLAQNLAGYSDYCAKVRWHLIPGVF